jgi:hypothetical protein
MLQDFYLLLFLYVHSIKEKEQGLSGLARKHDSQATFLPTDG